MKTACFPSLILLALLLIIGVAHAESDVSISGGNGDSGLLLSGDWTSSEGDSMTIHQTGNDFRADYNLKNGRIIGKLNGNSVEGLWIQDSSSRRCSYAVDNSYYWGNTRLNFTSQNYSGNWGYCSDEPSYVWSGSKK
ncbi:MAG: hypothetical protein ABSB95_11955 [Dissulfurispiraceae bacterium]|jgi:hypothetical protein